MSTDATTTGSPPWLKHSLTAILTAAVSILGTLQYVDPGAIPIGTTTKPSDKPETPVTPFPPTAIDLKALGRLDAACLAADYAKDWDAAVKAVEAGTPLKDALEPVHKAWSQVTSDRSKDASVVIQRALDADPSVTAAARLREYVAGLRGK